MRDKGKQLQRRRAEVVERSFAHVCTTGGARRTWIRGLVEVSKRYLVTVMAHNLGVILRALIGVGKPRELTSMRTLLASLDRFWSTIFALVVASLRLRAAHTGDAGRGSFTQQLHFTLSPRAASSTGC